MHPTDPRHTTALHLRQMVRPERHDVSAVHTHHTARRAVPPGRMRLHLARLLAGAAARLADDPVVLPRRA